MDGVSIRLFLNDLESEYNNKLSYKETNSISPYSSYCFNERKWIDKGYHQSGLSWWTQYLQEFETPYTIVSTNSININNRRII